ncbi:MAG: hypothetical protein ABIR62_14805 [Dokdonella sp.]
MRFSTSGLASWGHLYEYLRTFAMDEGWPTMWNTTRFHQVDVAEVTRG